MKFLRLHYTTRFYPRDKRSNIQLDYDSLVSPGKK